MNCLPFCDMPRSGHGHDCALVSLSQAIPLAAYWGTTLDAVGLLICQAAVAYEVHVAVGACVCMPCESGCPQGGISRLHCIEDALLFFRGRLAVKVALKPRNSVAQLLCCLDDVLSTCSKAQVIQRTYQSTLLDVLTGCLCSYCSWKKVYSKYT